MNLRLLTALPLLAAGCVFVTAALGAGEKKGKDKLPEEVIINSELLNADLKDKVLTESFCKTYTYKMVAGRTYQIDLKSRAFDAFLRLENPAGTQVAQDDDSGGNLNARIVHKAEKSGKYQIVATSLGGGNTGEFTLTIRQHKDK